MLTKSLLHNSSELVMTGFAAGILLILFVPIPSAVLDLLLIANFSWALTILLLAFYTDKPLDFSTFPALLLISTLFRLALNVSATRLILSDAHAGQVIGAIGQYVIHDNYVMGLVVFLILIIVQYVVVTNGAQRVAEVAARFTLDSMPGKQMSIDADLNMGLVSQDEARLRRSQIEKEANFYGAMDGASKFVKGDAIAGILIVLVDLIGGFAIGMAQKGMSLSESLHTYSLLTVGDGLITQIPALTIAMATGIIVTRAATDAQLGNEVAKQVSSYPKSLLMVCLCLLALLFLKGIPAMPVLLVLSLFATAAWYALRTKKQDEATPDRSEESLYEQIRIYPVEIQLNPDLYHELSAHEAEILLCIQQMRENIAFDSGFVIPEVKLRAEAKLKYPFYAIVIQGNEQGVSQLHMDKILAIAGTQVAHQDNVIAPGVDMPEPVYGLPARWVAREQSLSLSNAGFTLREPVKILANHLNQVVQDNLADLLSRNETETLLSQPAVRNLHDELIPVLLPFGHVQRILQNLLQERVSIRYLSIILETLLEHGKMVTDPVQLTELVRARLATPICQKLLSSQNTLPVLTLAGALEQKLSQSLSNNQFALEPGLTEGFIHSLANQVEKMISERIRPVLLCPSLLRRQIRQLTQRVIPQLTVLGMNEIPINIHVESYAVVNKE
ncbi:flagellar biosynthesis protein FlhA [Legionella sp. CNM-4043-24]|uniref:flagellar biosynthesis protein FlhA n=1 Tax=Legionella sp. CNM-4043-24 TaxID=3421646 RepID=UPI00403B0778